MQNNEGNSLRRFLPAVFLAAAVGPSVGWAQDPPQLDWYGASGGCSTSKKSAKFPLEFPGFTCNSGTCTWTYTKDLNDFNSVCGTTLAFTTAMPFLSGFEVDTPGSEVSLFSGITVGFTDISFNSTTQVLSFSLQVGVRNAPAGGLDGTTWRVIGEVYAAHYTKGAVVPFAYSCSSGSSTCSTSDTLPTALSGISHKYMGDGIVRVVLNANLNGDGFELSDLRAKTFWSASGVSGLAMTQSCTAAPANSLSCAIDSAVIIAQTTESAVASATRTHTGVMNRWGAGFTEYHTGTVKHFMCMQRGFELTQNAAVTGFIGIGAGNESTDCDVDGTNWIGSEFGFHDMGTTDTYDVTNYFNGTKLK